jgi:hypothetical protein
VSRRSTPLFRSSTAAGYSTDLKAHPGRVIARKRPLQLHVEFATGPCVVQTAEGAVHARAGDAIITGSAGERWPVHAERFNASYRPVAPTVAGQAGTYMTLPSEVLGIPMNEAFDVLLTDGRSRLHGKRGDWLVDYGDGSLGVVSREVFPATYEIIG